MCLHTCIYMYLEGSVGTCVKCYKQTSMLDIMLVVMVAMQSPFNLLAKEPLDMQPQKSAH